MSVAQRPGFFTIGVPAEQYRLPHPLVGLPVILLIRRVLLRAFELLRKEGFDFVGSNEDYVTAALRSTIENNLRQSGDVPGFDKRKFETVIRQGQWTNYDGTRLAKTPDLFFKLRDDSAEPRPVLSEFEGLFIEAKPVDKSHSVGSKYCDDGMIRFVRGDYAWAMQEAMMLGYVRGGKTITKDLIPAMAKSPRETSLGIVQLPQPCTPSAAAACSGTEAVHVSQHRRDFLWPHDKGQATDIKVYHLWYECS